MKTYTYKYPMPCVTTDVIIFGYDVNDEELKVLLIKRKEPPFKGQWALPGGHIKMNETLEQTALRELKEETGISSDNVHLEQLYSFGDPGRDPRGRYITVAYMALVNLSSFQKAKAGSDAEETIWESVYILKAGMMAFDHKDILMKAWTRLASKVVYQPVIFSLLPQEFTLTTLQTLYEIILNEDLDKRNFRKKILSMNILKPSNTEKGTAHRPATLYRFDKEAFWTKKNNGFFFEL